MIEDKSLQSSFEREIKNLIEADPDTKGQLIAVLGVGSGLGIEDYYVDLIATWLVKKGVLLDE